MENCFFHPRPFLWICQRFSFYNLFASSFSDLWKDQTKKIKFYQKKRKKLIDWTVCFQIVLSILHEKVKIPFCPPTILPSIRIFLINHQFSKNHFCQHACFSTNFQNNHKNVFSTTPPIYNAYKLKFLTNIFSNIDIILQC